nr:aminoglycoside phosphotransferase family protein [Micromonospora sp. DSM 115978]
MNTCDELLDLCRRHLDPDASPLRLHPGHAGTAVLRARTASHGDVVVKTHRDRRRHEQETHAYRTWAIALGNRAPTLLTAVDHPPSIIVTAASGGPLSERSLDRAAEHDAHRRAGEVLRLLHTSGPPRTDPDWTAWLAQRADYWLHQVGSRVTTRQRADLRAHMRALQDLAPIPTVPCHLDYTPRNLIHADDGHLCAIDFEHSRHDLAARDLVRFATRVWPHRPDLRD